MAKILQFHVTKRKICKPPCTYLKPHDYLIPKSMQWSPNVSLNKLEFDFDHEIMIMITLFDRVFFLICEATYFHRDEELQT